MQTTYTNIINFLHTITSNYVPLSLDMIMNPLPLGTDHPTVIADNPKTEADRTRYRWRNAFAGLNAFKKGFFKDYLTLLSNRSKWRKSSDNLRVGQLVIIVDKTVKRRCWKMGKVTAVEGTGDHIRRVTVRNPEGDLMIRDRSGVVRLELDE